VPHPSRTLRRVGYRLRQQTTALPNTRNPVRTQAVQAELKPLSSSKTT
jgi:hypothetical protein